MRRLTGGEELQVLARSSCQVVMGTIKDGSDWKCQMLDFDHDDGQM